jgi:hypothetical protein
MALPAARATHPDVLLGFAGQQLLAGSWLPDGPANSGHAWAPPGTACRCWPATATAAAFGESVNPLPVLLAHHRQRRRLCPVNRAGS